MKLVEKKRVSAKEAAGILGVPYQTISRIDRLGTIIKRYRLGHKTYVYDVESLEQFLLAKEVKPVLRPGLTRKSSQLAPTPTYSEERFSLKEFLPPKKRK